MTIQENAVKITKVKITKDRTLVVTYSTEKEDVITIEGANCIHTDLQSAMDKIAPFLAIITEQPECHQSIQDHTFNFDNFISEELRNVSVSQITIAESSSHGVIIGGARLLLSGKVLNINTPLVDIGEDSDFAYCDELGMCINTVCEEAKLYVFDNKAYAKQMELDFSNVEVPEFAEEIKEKKSRKRAFKKSA